MKITNISKAYVNSDFVLIKKRFNEKQLNRIKNDLKKLLKKEGFDAQVETVNSSRIDIKGPWGRSGPRIDVNKHGFNCIARSGRRTRTPTWDQYVILNNALNRYFSMYGIYCNITSLCFTIRKGAKVFTEADWYNQKPEWIKHNEAMGHYVEPY